LVIMDESMSLEVQGSFRFGAPAWFFIFTLVLWVCEVPFVSPWSIALFLCFREVVLCVCMSIALCHWGLYGVGVSSCPLFFTMPLVSSRVVWCWSFKLSFVFHYASCVIEGCMVLEFQALLCFSLCLCTSLSCIYVHVFMNVTLCMHSILWISLNVTIHLGDLLVLGLPWLILVFHFASFIFH
jgi:hypothetical protein